MTTEALIKRIDWSGLEDGRRELRKMMSEMDSTPQRDALYEVLDAVEVIQKWARDLEEDK